MCWRGFNRDCTFVELGDVLDDCETEAGATECAAAVFVDAVETLEETILALDGNSDAVVDHLDGRFPVCRDLDADFDELRSAVPERVLDEVGDG